MRGTARPQEAGTASPDGQSLIGTRLGFSVADNGRHDTVGFTGVQGTAELPKCMAPAAFFEVRDGDYRVTDANHWG
ncbi:hypothetical protein GCM10010435_07050 [Winogradskya consettensis]|uniref:Uncharacterized protein n=1 Tax=Winogradskya consettensis TaxID=113560 RepID=A0A919SQ15_9ACTN|nr:hypothetical protein [Actinoplanes consettensis]GIM75809.1 hypothetical protein Aco04nite_47190 [Actinoplanes consettensis]